MSKKAPTTHPARAFDYALLQKSQSVAVPAPDARPIVVLQLTARATHAQMEEQRALAQEHAEPFGLRVMVIPHDMNFSGVIQPSPIHRTESPR